MSAGKISSSTDKNNSVPEQRNRSAPIVAFTLTGQASRATSSENNEEGRQVKTDDVKSGKSNSTLLIQSTQDSGGSHTHSYTSFDSVTSIDGMLPHKATMQSTMGKESSQ